jgi:hypothetical protein
MKKQNRRKFITLSALLGTGFSALAIPLLREKTKKQVVHHVFFWLKNPGSKEDLNKLL